MTQELIDELLENITLLLNDLNDIQENSHDMNRLINQLELKVNDIGKTIHGLEQNAKHLDDRLGQVLECVMNRVKENITEYKAIS